MDKLKAVIDKLKETSRISKTDLTELKENIQNLTLTDEQIKVIQDLQSGYVKSDVKKTFLCAFTEKTVPTEVKNEQKDIASVETKINNNELFSSPVGNVQSIEKELDTKVSKYTGFDANHPMKYVSFNKPKKKYEIRPYGFKLKKNKDIAESCNLAKKYIKEHILTNIQNWIFCDNIELFKSYDIIVSYITNDNIELFDLEHFMIINDYSETMRNDIVNTLQLNKDKIYVSFRKNEFGGYILRKYIDKDKIVDLLFSSNKVKAVELVKKLDIKICNGYKISKEQKWLDIINFIFRNEHMITQFCIGTYRLDMCFTDYKIAIECDEYGHKKRDSDYELERQKYIESKGYKFIRFNPDDTEFDINKVIGMIHDEIVTKIKNDSKIL